MEYIGSAKKVWNNGTPLFKVSFAIKDYSDEPRNLDIYPIKGEGFSWGSLLGFPQDIVSVIGAAIEAQLGRVGVDIFTPN